MKGNFVSITLVGWMTGFLCQLSVSAQDIAINKWAPANIVIDGQANEWPTPLQFYNNVTKLFYTIANDQLNLYVIVKATDPQSQVKIMSAGFTFSVNVSGKKKGGASITFPLTEHKNTGAPDVPEASRALIALEYKKQLLASVKEVKIAGFDNIPDGNIPVQNTFGIQTASTFDASGNLVCELAVPLKILGIQPGSDQPVAYHFKVNALKMEARKEQEGRRSHGQPPPMPGQGPDTFSMNYTTDFWTKQILAAK